MAPQQPPYVQPGEPLNDFLRSFWQRQINAAEQETPDYRHPPLPLARIKKVMKSDPDVKMIAADAPILFCKACEIFIAEITARAFIIADSNKRRTLSRSDIAKALGKSDQFDFLIDIVPRDEIPFPGVVASANGPPGKKPGPTPVATKRDTGSTSGVGNNQTSPITLDAPSENNEVLNQLESLLGSSNQPERPPLS
ncbi:transcriptional regulator family: Histone-like TF [Agaricus bisporus var. burnettii]|uniref:Transcriptional regulator family: Histone-like TF n=1 Tax=Agaricus bisporus var. burnettii TaxID=192524 RepID=A0A8H7F308_AGABI|nr:transcriptional regulator family: Histone-like TF [Agaricus bisporus var. burnettii]